MHYSQMPWFLPRVKAGCVVRGGVCQCCSHTLSIVVQHPEMQTAGEYLESKPLLFEGHSGTEDGRSQEGGA